jgi:septum site-determining protein MinD
MGQTIAIVSGKGGTGKTSFTANVGMGLAQLGYPTLCLDCDMGLRNLDIALAMADSGAISFLEATWEEYGVEGAATHPFYPSLSFLTAPVNCPADQIPLDGVKQLLTAARKVYDYVLLDAPAGIEAGFRLVARFSDRIILVTGADPAAIRDAARAGEVLELMGKNNVRLVVNRLNKKALRTMGLTVDDIMDRAGLPLLGIVPEDINVMLSAGYKCPLLRCTRRGAAAACRRIAKRIQGRSVPVSL